MNPFRIAARPSEEEEQRAHIASIAEAGGVRSLPELLPFLPPEAHRLGPGAASAARSVLERCTPLQLLWFEQWNRSEWSHAGPPAQSWNDLRLGSVTWGSEYAGVVALASFHRNGFVRERAVKLLTDFDDGFELPYLLIRANDWVAEVQAVALEALFRRVGPAYTTHWLRFVGLLERMRGAQRRQADLARLVRRVHELLVRLEARPYLANALARGELAIRRACLRIVLTLPPGDGKALLAGAARDPDPVLAIAAARALLERASVENEELASIVEQALRHPRATVRVLALELALRHDLPSAVTSLRGALFDDARCVREVARHELAKRSSDVDFASGYRRAAELRQGRERTIAIEGLAEIGSRDDVPLFLQALGEANARVRAAAIVGLGRCDGANHLDALAAALRDASSVVQRAAMPYAKLYLGRGYVRAMRLVSRELR